MEEKISQIEAIIKQNKEKLKLPTEFADNPMEKIKKLILKKYPSASSREIKKKCIIYMKDQFEAFEATFDLPDNMSTSSSIANEGDNESDTSLPQPDAQDPNEYDTELWAAEMEKL